MTKIKRTENQSIGEDMKQLEVSYTLLMGASVATATKFFGGVY
jgi:hypothetical protein